MLAFGQDNNNTAQIQYPRLLRAEMPLYPSIAWSAHFGGVVKIHVSVKDGAVKLTELMDGKVIMQDPKKELSETLENKLLPYLVNPSLQNVKTWEFAAVDSGEFTVTFIYEIEGEETIFVENPKVEMELPFTIKVKVKPVKPTQF